MTVDDAHLISTIFHDRQLDYVAQQLLDRAPVESFWPVFFAFRKRESMIKEKVRICESS